MHLIIRNKKNGHSLGWLAYRSFNSMTGREGSGEGGGGIRNINQVYTGTPRGKQMHKTATHSTTNLSRKKRTDREGLSMRRKRVTIKPKITQQNVTLLTFQSTSNTKKKKNH